MTYLTIKELNTLLKENVINDLSEEDYTLLDQLENYSVSEIDAYIGFKFDTNAALTGKHPFLTMILIDILSYHFSTRMTHTSMQEIKSVRYETAKEWLKDVAKGIIAPNIPIKQEQVEYVSKNYYHTEPKLSNSY